MRIAIISDIHGNLPALETVLEEIKTKKPDQIVCLGDLVGYGPFPNECVAIIREMNIPVVMGNHDGAMIGKVPKEMFREPNASIIRWSDEILTYENRSFLDSLPMTVTGENWLATHAHPQKAGEWKYLESAIECRKVLASLPENIQYCFVGHTHIPAIVAGELGVFGFQKDIKYVINPGSIGQSRDGDSRASFCMLDLENTKCEIIRLDYPAVLALAGFDKSPVDREDGEYLLRLIRKK